METNLKKHLLDEFKIIALAFVLLYAFFQIHYFKESPLVILKTTIAHFYLFMIPGYSLLLMFYKETSRIERLVLGVGVGYALQSFLLYFISYFLKINMMKYNLLVSAVLILLGIGLFSRKLKRHENGP